MARVLQTGRPSMVSPVSWRKLKCDDKLCLREGGRVTESTTDDRLRGPSSGTGPLGTVEPPGPDGPTVS